MANSADEIVTRFVKEWDAPTPDVATLLNYFSDDAVYHNIPFPPAKGKAAIEKTLQGVAQMTSKGWEVVHQAANGDVVINERVDRFDVGGKTVAIPVCGVFEVKDGKIAGWRDYFDAATFEKQVRGES